MRSELHRRYRVGGVDGWRRWTPHRKREAAIIRVQITQFDQLLLEHLIWIS